MHYELALFRNAREGWYYSLQGDFIGEDFNPAMGFAPENDLWNANVGVGNQIKANDASKIQYIALSTNTNYKAKAISGFTETRYVNVQADIIWKSGAELVITPYSFLEDRILTNSVWVKALPFSRVCTT